MSDKPQFPDDVMNACRLAKRLGAKLKAWRCNDGVWMVAVWDLHVGGADGTALFEKLLATPGWGRYSANTLVWGWQT